MLQSLNARERSLVVSGYRTVAIERHDRMSSAIYFDAGDTPPAFHDDTFNDKKVLYLRPDLQSGEETPVDAHITIYVPRADDGVFIGVQSFTTLTKAPNVAADVVPLVRRGTTMTVTATDDETVLEEIRREVADRVADATLDYP